MCQNRRGAFKDGRKVTGLIFQKIVANSNVNNNANTANENINNSNIQNDKNRDRDKTKKKGNNSNQSGTGAGGTGSSTNNNSSTGTDSYGTSSAVQLLVTTNDSNIRLINMTDYSIACKYKGTVNESMQIKACMSEDGRYIICGSEIGRVLIWNTMGMSGDATKTEENNKGKGVLGLFPFLKPTQKTNTDRNNRFEYFYCIGKNKHAAAQNKMKSNLKDEETAATVAIFAPSSSVLLSCTMNGLNDYEIPAHKISSLCSSVIVTANARGNIEVFAKHFW